MEDRITRNMGAADLVVTSSAQPGMAVVSVTVPESNVGPFSASVASDTAMQLRLEAEGKLFETHADAGVWLAQRVRELGRDLSIHAQAA